MHSSRQIVVLTEFSSSFKKKKQGKKEIIQFFSSFVIHCNDIQLFETHLLDSIVA